MFALDPLNFINNNAFILGCKYIKNSICQRSLKRKFITSLHQLINTDL